MTTLLIGGCGFIGAHIVSHLAASGNQVLIYDTNADPANNSDRTTFIKGEFSDLAGLESVFRGYAISHVVHLVSTTLPKSSNDDMKFDLTSNVVQTLGLLDLCVKNQVKKVLFMSSGGTVYGVPHYLPVDEDHPTDPICSYGISKLAIEKYLALYKHLYGLPYVILRAANPYGPGQNPHTGQGIIANYIHRIYNGLPLEVWGDGNIVRDYFDVRDLVTLTSRALFSEYCGVFNAGSGTGTSINELLTFLSDITHATPKIVHKEQRKLDVPAIFLDSAKAGRIFDWHPSVSIPEGIANYIDWYCKVFQQNVTRNQTKT